MLCAGIVSCIQRLFTRNLVSGKLVTLTREWVSGRMVIICRHWAAHHLLASAIWATHPAVDPNTIQDTLTCGELEPMPWTMHPEILSTRATMQLRHTTLRNSTAWVAKPCTELVPTLHPSNRSDLPVGLICRHRMPEW